jgi:hypothetical protein
MWIPENVKSTFHDALTLTHPLRKESPHSWKKLEESAQKHHTCCWCGVFYISFMQSTQRCALPLLPSEESLRFFFLFPRFSRDPAAVLSQQMNKLRPAAVAQLADGKSGSHWTSFLASACLIYNTVASDGACLGSTNGTYFCWSFSKLPITEN